LTCAQRTHIINGYNIRQMWLQQLKNRVGALEATCNVANRYNTKGSRLTLYSNSDRLNSEMCLSQVVDQLVMKRVRG
jgi:hypothetical protein